MKLVAGIAVLFAGSAMPVAGSAHSEGVEAADPNTPPAVLTFDGAARRYTPLRTAHTDWRTRFANDETSMTGGQAGHPGHVGHAGAAQPTPNRSQQ